MSAARPEPLARQALAFVLAGGRGSRLLELTDRRAKPAVYFGGKSRIIDFALSNAVNSGIRRIAVATQYKAHSLIRHLQMGWNFFRPERNESFDILPASQRVSENMWYVGTADAVYQNIDIIESHACRFIVVLAGDHIYKMDYEVMLRQHRRQRRRRHRRLPGDAAPGIFRLRHHAYRRERLDQRVPGKAERSAADAGQAGRFARQHGHLRVRRKIPVRRAQARRRGSEFQPRFRQGHHPLPRQERPRHGAPVFDLLRSLGQRPRAYWRDVGTVDAYWAANIDLTDVVPELDLFDSAWPIWSYSEITPPAKFVHDEESRRGQAVSSLVSGGCIISGASLRRSLLFTGVRVNSYANVENAVIMPYVNAGRGARLKNVVIDRGVEIPEGLVVGEDPELDARRFRTTEQGISLITQPMLDRLNT